MKRLVGGDYLLDLSPIEIEESVDGETYTSITDKSVLDQLTGLKAFIGKSGMIKPIWVKLLNGETDEIVATRGSLSTSDGTTFLIKILLVGFILTLSVEFTQAETEDHTPLDEWYIDSGDAKYILISDAQAIGNIEELPVFENIVDKDGHKRFIEGDITIETIEGLTQTYGKWSLSGTHLMIVVCVSVAADTTISNGLMFNIGVPSWIKDKIKVLWGTDSVEYKSVTFYDSTDGTTQTLATILRNPSSGQLNVFNGQTSFTSDKNARIQFDLLIDNEETPAP